MKNKLRIAMLGSGGGTTIREIIRATKDGRLRYIEPALVIASNSQAGVIERALAEGVNEDHIAVIRRKDYATPALFGLQILSECHRRGVDFIGQYGWLVRTPENVIEAYAGMMVNQHPGPLDPPWPDFGGPGMYGRRVHCARLYFVRAVGKSFFTEVTAQRVDPEYDRGAVLGRLVVPISRLPRDTSATLAARVLPAEHALQIEVLRAFSGGRVQKLSRSERLVHPREVPILEEAKRVAKVLYPQG
jgi:phosphoribosylglycinamide formyltransferase-1